MSDAAGPRTAYFYAILDMPPGAKRRAEVRQMLVDLLDAVEQTPDEDPLIAALNAYDATDPHPRPRLGDCVELSIIKLSPLPATRDGARSLEIEVAKALGVPVACVVVTIDDGLTVEYRPLDGAGIKLYHRERLGNPDNPHPWEVRG